MNEDTKADQDEAQAEYERQAAHKKETEADLKRIDDDLAKVNLKAKSEVRKPSGLEARVTKLEERCDQLVLILMETSPEARAMMEKADREAKE